MKSFLEAITDTRLPQPKPTTDEAAAADPKRQAFLESVSPAGGIVPVSRRLDVIGKATALTERAAGTAQAELLIEYTDNRGVSLRVDRENHVIRGVKVMGFKSRNNRDYDPAGVNVALYEGIVVNFSHPKAPGDNRLYESQFGELRNVRKTSEGLFADLDYNPRHPMAESLLWDAEHKPHRVGMSPNQMGTVRSGAGGRAIVESVKSVRSVDIVPDPATTNGLFEHCGR